MSLKERSRKRSARRSISLQSQSSIELDTSKLLDIITSESTQAPDKEIRITRRSLAKISPDLNLTQQEIDIIFAALDSDDDGVITSTQLRRKIENGVDPLVFERNPDEPYGVAELSDDLSRLGPECQEQVCELYQQLHQSGNPDILETFESVILGVLRDLKQQQLDKERLEKSYKREKDQHEHHMRQMEEEMELQMQRVEDRVRKREQEKTENEKAEMRGKVEEEISMLQQNLKKLQQDGPEAKNKEIEDQLIQLKTKVEEMTFANRQLRSELTDAQTNVALLKGDYAGVKQQLNEKAHELDMEKETVTEYMREQENLTRQLHLLHDANKRLHDTNDDLREAIEVSRRKSPMRQQSLVSNTSTVHSLPIDRRGSLMSEYFQSTPAIRSRMNSTNSVIEEHEPLQTVSVHHYSHNTPRIIHPRLSHQETCESDAGLVEDIDSGHSTLRDSNENDYDTTEAFLNDAETMQRVLAEKRRRSKAFQQPLVEDLDTHDEFDTESEAFFDVVDSKLLHTGLEQKRLGSGSSRSSSRSSRSREGRDSSVGRGTRRQSGVGQDTASKLSKAPERMFKVVLAGDAAVGKSSLIMRLCKGKFVSNLSSTLGVDFQTKLIELDGRTIALQLWDTAGQERFRSIAKSYFRRADGVLLLYDCTYERSYMSIREWMESIEEGAIKKLPIMLCGNKTDQRPQAEAEGRKTVCYDEGQRLAREYSALFIETSAKDGSNILECVTELTRLMRANEDLEVKTVGLQLHDKTNEKNNKSCCGT